MFRFFLFAVAAALLLALGLWTHARFDIPQTAPVVVLTSEDIKLVEGRGLTKPQGLAVFFSDPGGIAVINSTLPRIPADRYASITWDADGFASAQSVRLTWTALTRLRTTRTRELTPEQIRSGRFELRRDAEWKGQILEIGLRLQGAPGDSILLRALALRPATVTFAEMLDDLKQKWGHFEPWSGRSINFHAGTRPDTKPTPVAMVAAWVGLTLLLSLAFPIGREPLRIPRTIALLAVLGWLVLDVRWQWELLERLRTTHDRYAGLSLDQRQSAAPDAKVIDLVRSIRAHLPSKPARVLILSADPHAALAYRVRYHLMPHRVHLGLTRLPRAAQVVSGNYILVLEPLGGIRFDPARKRLLGANRSIPADPVQSIPRFATLYRIAGGS